MLPPGLFTYIGLLERPGRIAGGTIRLEGKKINGLPKEEMRQIRGAKIGAIFQDPLTSLNPLYTIGRQLVQTIKIHSDLTLDQARNKAIDLLSEVGIPAARRRFDAYPHEFSGGMRQRVVVALALCANPQLIIADDPTHGEILFNGRPMKERSRKEKKARDDCRMHMIFQDPFASMDPRWRVRNIIAEPIKAFKLANGRAALQEQVAELLVQVGLSARDGEKYPHEFSGGQRQRISIARALSMNPDFLVCDEPTSALDVSVQAQILNLMKELQRRLELTYLFISHNLAVIHHISNDVGVMYLGRLCEVADKRTLFQRPQHPYTRLLLDTVPDLDITGSRRQPVAGEVPNPINPPPGCAFHPRCPLAFEPCSKDVPRLKSSEGAMVACHALEKNHR